MEGTVAFILKDEQKAVIETTDGQEHKFLLKRFKYDDPDVDDEVVIKKGENGAEIYRKEKCVPTPPKMSKKPVNSEVDEESDFEDVPENDDILSTNTVATPAGIAGFVFACGSFVGGLIPAVIGLIISFSAKSKEKRDRFATAGILIATIQTILLAAITILVLIVGGITVNKVRNTVEGIVKPMKSIFTLFGDTNDDADQPSALDGGDSDSYDSSDEQNSDDYDTDSSSDESYSTDNSNISSRRFYPRPRYQIRERYGRRQPWSGYTAHGTL